MHLAPSSGHCVAAMGQSAGCQLSRSCDGSFSHGFGWRTNISLCKGAVGIVKT